MSMITFLLANVAGWIATFYVVREGLRVSIKENKERWNGQSKWYQDRHPDDNPEFAGYPWGKFFGVFGGGLIATLVASFILALIWPVTWFVGIFAGLYFFVPKFKSLADNTWARAMSFKASIEAKLRGE